MTTRHQPAAQNSALIDTAVRVLASLSTTPFFRNTAPEELAELAYRRAWALWDLIDREAADARAARVPDAEDCYDPGEADRLHVQPVDGDDLPC